MSKTLRANIGYKMKDWIPIIISGASLLYFWQPWQYLTALALLILIVNFLVVASLLWWADGYEREPLRTISWAIFWGAFVAIFLTSLITPGSSALYMAAIVEELSKLLGLYWIYKRGSIHSATDALVIGGFIGLGFTIFEDFTYAAGEQQAIEILISRGIFSVFAHTLFSGAGAAIIFLLWKQIGSSGAILGFIFSYFIHFLWNISLTLDIAYFNFTLYLIIYSILPPLIVFSTCVGVRRNEMNLMRFKGHIALSKGIVTNEMFDLILNRKFRKSFLKALPNITERLEYKSVIHSNARKILEIEY